MKKALKLFLFLALAIIFITGCQMKEYDSVTITADKKVTLQFKLIYGDEFIDSMLDFLDVSGEHSGDYTDEDRWAYLEDQADFSNFNGYQMDTYDQDCWKGYTFTRTNENLDDMVYDASEGRKSISALASEKKLFTKEGNTYTLQIGEPSSDSQISQAAASTTSGDDEIGFILTVTLPHEPETANAKTVSEDKLTYTWDVLAEPNIELVFELPKEEKKEEKEPEKTEEKEEVKKEEVKEEPKKEEEKKEEEKEEPKKEEPKKSAPVSWSKADKWAIDELSQANDLGVIPETFEAKDFTAPIDRKDFAAAAVKLYEAVSGKAAKAAEKNPFTDTKDEYVLKAFALGITKGTSDTTFSPDAQITREQMATMLARALETAGIKVEANMAEATPFADDAEMSSWAKESVYFMSQKGIIKGMGENTFGAKSTSTIQQAVIIVERSVKAFAK